MRSWTAKRALGLVVALVVWAGGAQARAAVKLTAEEIRSYDLPAGFGLDSARFVGSAQGRTLIYGDGGQGAETACVVISATDAAATAFSYQREGGPTSCAGMGVLGAPDGGFFIRGFVPGIMGEAAGFTARLDAEGVEAWRIEDQALVDARAEGDGGTGEFLGAYVEPHPALAYSERFDRLLAFTNGKLSPAGQEKLLTQAHVVSDQLGRLSVSGQTFGPNSLGVLGGVVTLGSDGQFLIFLEDNATRGATFYRYNGRNMISAFKPLGEGWTQRLVRQLRHDGSGRLVLLWSPIEAMGVDVSTRLSASDDGEGALWAQQWPAEAQTAQGAVTLSAPLGLWIGAAHGLVLYQDAMTGALLVRAVDMMDGRSIGVAPLDGLTPHTPLAIVEGASGALVLVTRDEASGRIVEHRLSVEDTPDVPQPGADMGGADMGGGGGSGGEASGEGCGCRSAHAPAPERAPVVALGALLGGLLLVRRRPLPST